MHASTLVQSLAAAAVLSSSLATGSTVPADTHLPSRREAFSGDHGSNFPASHKRRHHAKIAELSKRNLSPRALLSLTGFGTLYYDVNGGGTCGPANGWSSFPESNGYTMCEPWTGPKTIMQRGSNRIVALPVSMMTGNLEKYCGKEVVAHYKGKTISGLIAWDGCAACDQGNGIDFSSSLFGELVGTENCGAGKVQGVTWEITNNQIWDTNGNVVGSGSGNSGGQAPKSSSEWQGDVASSTEKWVEPSSSSSSSSSKWVEPSSSKWVEPSSSKWVEPSSSKWVEPSSSKWVEPSSSKWVEPSSSKWTEPSPSSSEEWQEKPTRAAAVKNVDNSPSNEGIDSMRLPLFAAAQSASSDSAEEVKPTQESKAKAVAQKASAFIKDNKNEEEETCDDKQGQWRCDGKALRQCVQSTGKWIWSKRVECSVEPINCDTANPVCPGKASCPTRRQARRL